MHITFNNMLSSLNLIHPCKIWSVWIKVYWGYDIFFFLYYFYYCYNNNNVNYLYVKITLLEKGK
jgi:hypothetical protein